MAEKGIVYVPLVDFMDKMASTPEKEALAGLPESLGTCNSMGLSVLLSQHPVLVGRFDELPLVHKGHLNQI